MKNGVRAKLALSVCGTLLGALALPAYGDEPALATEVRDLQAQVQDLKTRLEDLQRVQSLTRNAHPNDVKKLVDEILTDAQRRSKLPGQGATVGYDDGFYVQSADGNFSLKLFGMFQVRHTYDTQDSSADVSGDEDRSSFELSRVRIGLRGNVVDPTWEYMVLVGNGADGSYILLDAYVVKKLNKQWAIQAGQFKVPLWKEFIVSETRQPLAERSLLSMKFSGSYTEGVTVGYAGERVSVLASINDGLSGGASSGITGGGHTSPWSEEDVEGYGVSGRVEFLVAGAWKQGTEYESWRGDKPAVIVGAAAHYQQGEYGTASDEARIIRWSADVLAKCSGFSLSAAVLGNHVDDSATVANVDQYGALLQGGWFATPNVELVARYEWGDSDMPGEDDLSIVTLGVNWFIVRHRLKLTADIGYALNSVGPSWCSSGTGWRADSSDSDGQIVTRAQLQLLF